MSVIVVIGSGVSRLEWQLQGIVAAINALPALLVTAIVAIFGFFSAIWLRVFGWFLFGLLAGMILLYAVFCIAVAVALCRRKEWALIACGLIYLVYICLYYWPASDPSHSQAALSGQGLPQHQTPLVAGSLRVLLLFNVLALIHIPLRWVRLRSEQ